MENPYKCPKSGFCVASFDLCEEQEKNLDESNGCPKGKKIKCPISKKCVSNINECYELDSQCPTGTTMCSDGYCSNDFEDCNSEAHLKNCGYDGRKISCPNLNEPCAKSVGECYNSLNCKVDTPFRCANGECKRYPSKNGGGDGCSTKISCPSYKPFLCADGSCVEKLSFCKSYMGCSGDKPYLCNDKTCAKSLEECQEAHEKCPANNPIMCENGNCVESIYECDESKCPSWSPYYCVLGECQDSPRKCQEIELNTTSGERMISSVCNDNEFICSDGSCRNNQKDCPIYEGCVNSDKSFKCLDGGCASEKKYCKNQNNVKYFECPANMFLCEDGICRKDCSLVEYNGCPNSKPLLCPNGRCVSTMIECAGESSCISTEKPFRCIDGTCVSHISKCKTPFREVGATNIAISVYPKIEVNADLIIGPNNILSGRVIIPAETITNKNDHSTAETLLYFKSVTRNKIEDTYMRYNETRIDDLKSIYPYADPNNDYTLGYQYTVLSSAIEIKLNDSISTEISRNILLTLLFDFPINHESLTINELIKNEIGNYSNTSNYSTQPLNHVRDVCLGKLNTNTRKWECNGLNYKVEEKSNLQLTGELNEEGIYAVILNLTPNYNQLYIEPNWFISHLTGILIFSLIFILILGISIYIFIRMFRYRAKYKGTKELFKGIEKEFDELRTKSVTGRRGETFSDIKEGIIYTDNVAFKSEVDNDKRLKNHQLEKMFDSYNKKLKILERNNALLKEQYDSIKNEIDRIKEFKKSLEKGNETKIDDTEIKDINNIGMIVDDQE